MQIDEDIVGDLQEFDLTKYGARVYYVLLSEGISTAGSLSKLSDVPQSRIYDVLSTLERKGLIQVKPSSPKKYEPLPVKTGLDNRIRQIEAEYEARIQELREMVEEIADEFPEKETQPSVSGSGVRIVEGEDAIEDRILEMLKSANDEVKLAGERPLFTLNCKGMLQEVLSDSVELMALGTFEEVCKSEISAVGGKIRHTDFYYHYLLIIDDKKMLIISFDDDGLPFGLYTENPDLIQTHIHHYLALWDEAEAESSE
ncbi:TrmB family transcriptional regulator [Halorutilales archaeon Cl-col2-1]